MSDLPPRVLLSTSNFSSHSCPLLSVSPPLLSLSLKFLSSGRELSLLSLSPQLPSRVAAATGRTTAGSGGRQRRPSPALVHADPAKEHSGRRADLARARGRRTGLARIRQQGSQFRRKSVEFREISRFRQSSKVEAV